MNLMKKRKCFLFVFNGYADWEPALVVASLNTYSDFSIHTFSVDGLPIRSMAGITIQPDTSADSVDPDSVDLLLLPGGDAWKKGENREITRLVKSVAKRKGNIAAICDGTLFLASLGYLDRVWHTSNGPGYLSEHVASYKGRHYYENLPAVVDDNIITANGAGMIEFTVEILRQQKVFDQATLEKVSELYKSGGVSNRLYQ
jgi:putative intracellular protease/amidase